MINKKYATLFILLFMTIGFGCTTLQEVLKIRKPSASLQGIKFENITLDSAQILFDVEVENPYPVAIPLVNVDYNLTSNAKPFLSGKANLQSTVGAYSKESVSLPVMVNYLDLIQAIKGLKPGSLIPYSADMGLSVDAPTLGLIRLPIKKEGELSVPSLADISEINWKKMILDKTMK